MSPSPKRLFKPALLIVFVIGMAFLLLLQQSCKKTDSAFNSPTHEADFLKKFFETKTTPTAAIAAVIEKFKKENERTGFVNKLPANCGLPLWEKIVFQKNEVANSNNKTATNQQAITAGEEGKGNIIIIPLTLTNKNLSSIIIAKSISDTITVNCYTTNDYLYNITHGDNVDTVQAMKELNFFFYMENQTFGTTKFYHIPANLFGKSKTFDTDRNKTITLKSAEPTVSNLAITVCVTYSHCVGTSPCTNTYCDGCNLCQTVDCTTISTGGGGCTTIYCGGGGTGTGGGSTGGGSGGGTGGGGSGTGGGTPCNSLTGGDPWYILNPNPCNPPPPLPPDTILHPCDNVHTLIDKLYFILMMQDLKNHCNNSADTTEHGWVYEYTSSGGGLFADSIIGKPGKKEIEVVLAGKKDGVAHNHFVNSLSIFSPDDLKTISEVFLARNMKDSSTFTMPLVTADSTPYLLMIENVTKFRHWAQNFATGTEKDFDVFKWTYAIGFGINETNTIAVNENKFLIYLKSNGGAGLRLFRGNSTFIEWTPIGLDANNKTINIPCE